MSTPEPPQTLTELPEKPPPSPAQIWLMAARPRTLPAAAAPVLVGCGAAWGAGHFAALPALAALFAALLIQIGTNFANDLFDFVKGADTGERLGPLRVTQAGLVTPRAIAVATGAAFGLAAVLGAYLVLAAGWPVLLIGGFSILAGLAYTGGPYPLGYNGLGDVFVFLFFGLAAVGGTYFVQAHTISTAALLAGVPMGFLATAILVVNNLRDVSTDTVAGKKTLAVRFGANFAKTEYAALTWGAYATLPLLWIWGHTSVFVLLPLLSLPLLFRLLRTVRTVSGRPLNAALGGTGQLELVFGILLTFGLILPPIF